MTKKQQKCDHIFQSGTNPPTYELIDGGVDKYVVCEKCGLEAWELYLLSNVHTEDGTIVEE